MEGIWEGVTDLRPSQVSLSFTYLILFYMYVIYASESIPVWVLHIKEAFHTLSASFYCFRVYKMCINCRIMLSYVLLDIYTPKHTHTFFLLLDM